MILITMYRSCICGRTLIGLRGLRQAMSFGIFYTQIQGLFSKNTLKQISGAAPTLQEVVVGTYMKWDRGLYGVMVETNLDRLKC